MIYFDCAATTKTSDKALQKMLEVSRELYGNPSSIHKMGLDASNELQTARKIIANSLCCSSSEIYFNSGGTESANTAIFGAYHAKKRWGGHIVTTAIEHACVSAPIKELENIGCSVTYVKPHNGIINFDDIAAAIKKDTILVSLMHTNNETGEILPLNGVKKAINDASSPALFHIDAAQGFLKGTFSCDEYMADLISFSAHKIGAPKGVGALYIRNKTNIKPLIFGGGQENALRSGTENVPAIAAFGTAVAQKSSSVMSRYIKAKELNNYLRERLISDCPFAKIISPYEASPYILSMSLPGYNAETILHYLESKEIYVSGGAACSSKKKKISHVLEAIGLPEKVAMGAVRVSFCEQNTNAEVDILIKELINCAREIMKRV